MPPRVIPVGPDVSRFPIVRRRARESDIKSEGGPVSDLHETTHCGLTKVAAGPFRDAEMERAFESRLRDEIDRRMAATPAMLHSIDQAGLVVSVSDAWLAKLGYRRDEVLGRPSTDFLTKESRLRALNEVLPAFFQVGRCESVHYQMVKKCGGAIDVLASAVLADDPSGSGKVSLAVITDITTLLEAKRLLIESEARYRFLAENSSDMILLVDQRGHRIYASPASRKLLGFDPHEVVSQKLQDAIHPDDAPRVLAVLSGSPGDTLLSYRMRRKDGSYVWVETTGKTVEIAGGERQRLIIVRDISTRKAVEDQLAEAHARLKVLSNQDGLTELANRRAFDETLTREHGRAEREERAIALIMIDVDRFKLFNDRYGHPAGDECLRRIAKAITASVRRPGDVAARYGGEEFAVVLPNTDEAGAMTVATNIQRAVRELEIEHGESEWGIATVSVGVAAVLPSTPVGALDVLLRDADRALYLAKDRGRNATAAA
jgi:diguanylate cyclase (GGDEF)-like protein/PAS domain S-box-containing protein